jgi:MFS family permease
VGFIAHGAIAIWLGLIVVRSILGLVNAPLHPASARMVYETLPPRSRAFANGLVTFSACVGIASTYYVLGTLIDWFDWPTAIVISAGLTFAVTLILYFASYSSTDGAALAGQHEPAKLDLAHVWPVLRRRSVVCITLSYAALGYFQYLFFYWIEYYFEQIQHQDRSVARGYSTMITLAMGFGMIAGGWLADRMPQTLSPKLRRALVPVTGMIASGVVFELGLLGPNARSTLVAFAIAAALIGACEGSFWTVVVELGRRFGGITAGLMNTGGNAGGTLSPYVTPLLSAYFARRFGEDMGWRLSLAVAGVIVIAGALLWVGVDPAAAEDQQPGGTQGAEAV